MTPSVSTSASLARLVDWLGLAGLGRAGVGWLARPVIHGGCDHRQLPDPNAPEELEARRECERRALRHHWELRQNAAFARMMEQVQASCQAYLNALGLRTPAERGSIEFDSHGEEILWSWASVHHDGINHLVHDHPASLVKDMGGRQRVRPMKSPHVTTLSGSH